MTRRPKVKRCEHRGSDGRQCTETFTGRGLYCGKHRASRDRPGSTFRKERKAESKRRRRDRDWSQKNQGSHTTGVTTPLYVSAGQKGSFAKVQPLDKAVSRSPAPIDVIGTPGMTVGRAIDQFMAAWNLHHQPEGSTTP